MTEIREIFNALIPVVKDAIMLIRNARFNFNAHTKGKKESGSDDIVTNADLAAQALYRERLQVLFPTFGLVGEEENLAIDSQEPDGTYFTLDPLDGTSAFNRQQSHGFSTMISLVRDGQVVLGMVGDIMSLELQAWHIDRPGIIRIDLVTNWEETVFPHEPTRSARSERDFYVQLRKPSSLHGLHTQNLLKDFFDERYDVHSGSIGLSMGRLFTGEVRAAILRPGKQTPWDTSPIIGAVQHLGFSLIQIPMHGQNLTFKTASLPILRESVQTNNDLLVIHASYLPSLRAWCEQKGYIAKF